MRKIIFSTGLLSICLLFFLYEKDSFSSMPISAWRVVKKFGPYYDHRHEITIYNESITLQSVTLNANVGNLFSGRVVLVKRKTKMLKDVVVVKSQSNFCIVYANLEDVSPMIKEGVWIEKDVVLGSANQNLIVQVTQDGKIVDPERLWKNRDAS